MSTDLTVAPEFRALAEGSEAAELLEANLGGESLRSSDLTWVKIPTGGATRWSWTTKSGAEFSEKVIRGLLVVVGKVEQVLWPHREATSGSRPLLISNDGVVAHKVGTDYGDLDANAIEAARNADGTYDVKKIAEFQFAKTKDGKWIPPRAKSSRVLGILREEDALPVFVRVSATSLKPVDNLLRGLTGDALFHYRAVVELGLEKKSGARADYAVVTCKCVGSISPEDGRAAKARFTARLTPVVCPPIEDRAARAASAAVEEAIPF